MSLEIMFSGIFLAVAGLMLLVTRKPTSKAARTVGKEWLAEMSVDRYRPMVRLLDSDDLQFVAGQPGCKWGMIRRLRKQRCEAFARYLGNLRLDFERAYHMGLFLAAKNRATLRVLNRTRRQFGRRVFVERQRLGLYRRFGIGAVQAERLVELFQAVGAELHMATMPAQAHELGFQVSTSHFQRPSSVLQ